MLCINSTFLRDTDILFRAWDSSIWRHNNSIFWDSLGKREALQTSATAEVGSSKFIRTLRNHLLHYTVPKISTTPSKYSWLWKPQISTIRPWLIHHLLLPGDWQADEHTQKIQRADISSTYPTKQQKQVRESHQIKHAAGMHLSPAWCTLGHSFKQTLLQPLSHPGCGFPPSQSHWTLLSVSAECFYFRHMQILSWWF